MVPQQPSFSPASSPDEWCPAPDLPPAAVPLLRDNLCNSCILFRSAQATDKGVADSSEYASAHDSDWILHPVTIYDVVFDLCHHCLPGECRKFRSGLLSISNRWSSYACSATMSLGAASFLGRSWGSRMMPAAKFRSFPHSRLSSPFITCLS